MRATLLIFLILGLVSANLDMPLTDIAEIFRGFFHGLNKDNTFGNVTQCVSGVKMVVQCIEDFIDKLKEVKWENLESVLDFVSEVGRTGEIICDAVDPCLKIHNNVVDLIDAIKSVNFEVVLKDAKDKIFELINWVNGAVRAIVEKDHYSFGLNIGKLTQFVIMIREPPQ